MPDSFCVASEGGGKPHVVTRNKKGVVVCDEACLGWRSQMCSYALAVAETMGCLDETVQGYRNLKQPTSYTATLTHGLSKDVGKKPGATSKRKGPANVFKPDIQTCRPLQELHFGRLHQALATHSDCLMEQLHL